RTVLFVSHNMASISQLCSRGMLLKNGKIEYAGDIHNVVNNYIESLNSGTDIVIRENSNAAIYFKDIVSCNNNLTLKSVFRHDEDIYVKVDIKINNWPGNTYMGFYIQDLKNRKIFTNNNLLWENMEPPQESLVSTLLKIPGNFLVPGTYRLSFAITSMQKITLGFIENAVSFTIIDTGTVFNQYDGFDYGCVFANCEWSFIK
ncbi:MAG TPA: Wzt carbohydrate-binding domain-containing protein, partial [Bacteroidales bacterium]|nr:Wzt carbohydrate-binding domain-containing protein [Bacteroidales bacterium]